MDIQDPASRSWAQHCMVQVRAVKKKGTKFLGTGGPLETKCCALDRLLAVRLITLEQLLEKS